MTIVNCRPPVIQQYFHKDLLTICTIVFRLEELMEIANYIKHLMNSRKYSKHKNTLTNLSIEYQKVKELYGLAKIKEEQTKDKKNKATQRLFYRPVCRDKNAREVYNRLRHRYARSAYFRKNNGI